MKKIIFILLAALLITACSHPIIRPYHPPIQQGNIITDDMTKRIKPGLSKSQVVSILGEPVLNNPFEQNTWIYIYTFQPSKGAFQRKRLTIYFKNDHVSNYTVDLPVPTNRNSVKNKIGKK